MRRKLTIYYTSDLHSTFYPTDYCDSAEKEMGLFRLVPHFHKDGNTLLIDGGDILQGSPLASYQKSVAHDNSLIAEIMTACGYDLFTLGNHDFNDGMVALQHYISQMQALCVCENLLDPQGHRPYPAIIKNMDNGLRVGIFGLVTDHVNIWERPENLESYRVIDPLESARSAVASLRPSCDFIIGIYHGGFERDLSTGALLSNSRENIGYQLCREIDLDLLLTGHQHISFHGRRLFGTYTLQPAAQAREAYRVDIEEGDKGWKISSESLKADQSVDEKLLRRFAHEEEKVQHWLDQEIGSLDRELRSQDHLSMALKGSPIASFLNAVQLHYSGADVSATSLANEVKGFPRKVSRRDILANYPYSNTLLVLEVDGRTLRQAMERSASYFNLDEQGSPRISERFLKPKVEHYNYDYYGGVEYELDLRRPLGQRVTKLQLRGNNIRDDQTLSLCLNDYRAKGGGGYDFLRDCKRLHESTEEMSELITRYFEEGQQNSELSKQIWAQIKY